VVGGCARQAGPPRHLILIVVDTLRADVLGCYGGEAATPNIDRLAAEGVRFDQARSHIPITGPSHLSLFTSLLPHQHGVRNNTQGSSVDKERQLFDLAEDPGELDNLALQEPELAEAMHEELLRALTDGRAERIAQPAELSQEEIEGLEALGYRQ